MAYEVMSALFFWRPGFLASCFSGVTGSVTNCIWPPRRWLRLELFVSATWILSVNNWMQTPAGYMINENGQFLPDDWLAIIFNPSFLYRLVHMVLAAHLTVAFVVGAVSALHLLRDRTDPESRRSFSMAMWIAVLFAPLQMLAGDQHGLNTLEHQPIKVAAMEGHFEHHSSGKQPLALFGIPNTTDGRLDYAIETPYLGSLILTHTLHDQIRGLNEFPKTEWPPVAIVFFSFRVMVAIGMAMLALARVSAWARYRLRLFDWPWLLRAAVGHGPVGI